MEHSRLTTGSTFVKRLVKLVAKNGVERLVLSGSDKYILKLGIWKITSSSYSRTSRLAHVFRNLLRMTWSLFTDSSVRGGISPAVTFLGLFFPVQYEQVTFRCREGDYNGVEMSCVGEEDGTSYIRFRYTETPCHGVRLGFCCSNHQSEQKKGRGWRWMLVFSFW